jgi:hypothetical protein
MRCENCGSMNTVKCGKRKLTIVSLDRKVKRSVQRYQCNNCCRTFSKRRERGKKYGFEFKKKLANMHVEKRMSYRVMSKTIIEEIGKKISPTQLCKMVNEVAFQSKGSLQIKNEFKPKWEGYLVVDDKNIDIKGEQRVSLIARDSSGDIVHEELLDSYTQENFDNFFRYIVERLEYPFKSLTTDLDEMLEKSKRLVIGAIIPHQKCIWHGIETIKRIVGYQETAYKHKRLEKLIKNIEEGLEDRKGSYTRQSDKKEEFKKELIEVNKKYLELEEMLKIIKKMLYAKTSEDTKRIYETYKTMYSRKYPQVVGFMNRHLDGLTMHQKDDNIPKTSNLAENLNKQLMRRFKTIEAFQTFNTAFNYLNLICNYLRFKPYTDCKGKRKWRNGKSPLELCGVKLKNKNWIYLSINKIKI